MRAPDVPLLRPDCGRCAGLCCVALPFARSADFPEDKPSGIPCRHLTDEHRCEIHASLRETGWVGCTVFECFGAGQRVTQHTFDGRSWRDDTALLAPMTAVFPVVHRLHEMLWYLGDPGVATTRFAVQAHQLAREIDELAGAPAGELAGLDITAVRTRVAMVLRAVSDEVRGRAAQAGRAAPRLPRPARPGGDLAGARLGRCDLRSAPLRGALLIAADLSGADLRGADLLGADLRDANLAGARLDDVLFLTQPQVNAARGDGSTRLPTRLEVPRHWA